jgi:hypothetical protein
MTRARFVLLIGAGLTMAAGGCFKPVLTANDAVARPDGTVQLVAFLENATLPGLSNSIRRQQIAFSTGRTQLGQARSGEEGRAILDCRLPTGATTYTATAQFLIFRMASTGRVFRWTKDRTILIVDIDDTICDTNREEIIFQKRDLESSPIHDSQPTLARLAESFQIAYLTARPESLFVKTVNWLNDHRFPPGPVFVAPSLGRMIRQTKYKTDALRTLRADWPNIRIGIGDSRVDARAYSDNGMLTLIVAEEHDDELDRQAIVLRDWAGVEKFFDSNRPVLTDPASLTHILETGGAFVVPYAPARDNR